MNFKIKSSCPPCNLVNEFMLIVLLICLSFSSSQGQAELTIIEQQFKKFQYDSVIVMSERTLASDKNLATETKIEIYRMKAISHYSLSQLNSSFNCFVEILKLDANFHLDESTTSPKIVRFFDDIKKGFVEQQKIPVQKIEIVKTDTVRLVSDKGNAYRNALFRSMVLPGWGHFHIKRQHKGLLLSGLSIAAFAGSVYSTMDCRDKQELYLNEIDKTQMNARYENYNSAYKMRSGFYSAFITLWIYSQIDLLFFNEDNLPGELETFIAPTVNKHGAFLSCIISF